MDDSNQRYSLDEPQLTRGEASELSGSPTKDLDNWHQRGVIDLGRMTGGRRLYSIMDVFELKIIRELTTVVQVAPSIAASVARHIRNHPFDIAREDQYAIFSHYDGVPQIGIVTGEEWRRAKWSHPFVVISIGDMFRPVFVRAVEIMANERPPEPKAPQAKPRHPKKPKRRRR